MARLSSPLLSFGASGQIAKSLVFAKWRGISYARQHVIPENPRSTEQTKTRSIFTTLNEIWLKSPTLLKAPWTRYAAGLQMMDRNAFIGKNITVSRDEANFDAFIFSPGAAGGVPPTGIDVSAAGTTITVDFTVPEAPLGWELVGAVAAAFPNQAPGVHFEGAVHAVEDLATPWSVDLPDLVAGTEYIVGGWLRWLKDGNRPAYSPSLVDTISTP